MAIHRKPRLLTSCVANHSATTRERIAEFSFPGTPGPAGGLISLRYVDGMLPVVELYQVEGCVARVHYSKPPKHSWEAVFGHLGTPDEVGNEFIAIKEQRDELAGMLERLCDHRGARTSQQIDADWSSARAMLAKLKGAAT